MYSKTCIRSGSCSTVATRANDDDGLLGLAPCYALNRTRTGMAEDPAQFDRILGLDVIKDADERPGDRVGVQKCADR
jgi:hypothetical protein